MQILTFKPTVEQKLAFKQVNYKSSPGFLGKFHISYYGQPYGRGRQLPEALDDLAQRMTQIHPEQTFNAAFIQKYEQGAFVAAHRDPRSNTGHTLIAVFGDFDGGMTTIDGYAPFTLEEGDILSLECTINGIQGPRHEVSEITRGTRYALILNTCI